MSSCYPDIKNLHAMVIQPNQGYECNASKKIVQSVSIRNRHRFSFPGVPILHEHVCNEPSDVLPRDSPSTRKIFWTRANRLRSFIFVQALPVSQEGRSNKHSIKPVSFLQAFFPILEKHSRLIQFGEFVGTAFVRLGVRSAVRYKLLCDSLILMWDCEDEVIEDLEEPWEGVVRFLGETVRRDANEFRVF